jgi:hypothetical protein
MTVAAVARRVRPSVRPAAARPSRGDAMAQNRSMNALPRHPWTKGGRQHPRCSTERRRARSVDERVSLPAGSARGATVVAGTDRDRTSMGDTARRRAPRGVLVAALADGAGTTAGTSLAYHRDVTEAGRRPPKSRGATLAAVRPPGPTSAPVGGGRGVPRRRKLGAWIRSAARRVARRPSRRWSDPRAKAPSGSGRSVPAHRRPRGSTAPTGSRPVRSEQGAGCPGAGNSARGYGRPRAA